jgi:hypothetical protein
MTSINDKCRFLTTGEYLPLVVFCREGSTFRWRFCVRELLYMASAISLLLSCSIFVSREMGNKCHHPQSPYGGKALMREWVLPDAPKGSLTTLLSPPKCHAAFGTIRHTLASLDQSPIRRPNIYPLPRQGHHGLNFGVVHTHTHTHTHTHIYSNVHAYMHKVTHAHTHTHTHKMHTFMHAQTHTAVASYLGSLTRDEQGEGSDRKEVSLRILLIELGTVTHVSNG